jgi:hypothetical protein
MKFIELLVVWQGTFGVDVNVYVARILNHCSFGFELWDIFPNFIGPKPYRGGIIIL